MTPLRHAATVTAMAGMVLSSCSSGDGERTLSVAASTTTPSTAAEPDPTTTVIEPGETIAPVAATPSEPSPMPDEDFQHWLRTRWEHTVGDGPGLIEAELGFAPVLLEPGTYTTDATYTPLTFELSEPMRLLVERPTFMVLVDHTAQDLWSVPIIHVIRPRALTDPATTADGPPEWPGTVEAWDFDAWFAAHPGIEVERSDVVVGGVESVRYDLSFPDPTGVGWQCMERAHCVALVIDFGGPFDLHTSDPTRMWVIPQDEHAPIVIHAAIGDGEQWGDFGDHVDAIVASLELGETEPVDIADQPWAFGLPATVPGGTVEFPILGGVRFDLPGEHFVQQERGWSLINVPGDYDFFPPNVEIATARQAFDFTPIESAEQLADVLVTEAGAVRRPDDELLGRPAVVVEMLGVQPGIPVFRHAALPDDAHPDVAVWYTQDYVELWAADTDDGVLFVTAEAANPEELAIALELHEHVRNSLELL
ncbi:MAG: hypothetical protein HKN41_06565 [Ilumatobacter sp.]|nr:hypothetical protein [Ilumatobacter sp.]